jgi:hypothetical protein
LQFPDGQLLNNYDSTPQAPAACDFVVGGFGYDEIHLFWTSNDKGNKLYHCGHRKGGWDRNGSIISQPMVSKYAPAVCTFGYDIYLFWRTSARGFIYYSASADGYTWPPGTLFNQSDSTAYSPAACVFDGSIYVFWGANDIGHNIYFSASANGAPWPDGRIIKDSAIGMAFTTDVAPAACVFGKYMFLFWVGIDDPHYIYYSKTLDGISWDKALTISAVDYSRHSPTACCYGGALYLFWSESKSNSIRYSYLTNI